MNHSRRHWLGIGCGLAAASVLGACATRPAIEGSASAGFMRYRLGQARITAVSDGITARPLDAGFVRNVPLPQVQAMLAAQSLRTTHIDVPYTCFVIELQGKHYLLDTGFADNGPAGTGLLHQHMRAAGIDPASIDAVIISHLHGDHINGLRHKDGALVYPKAQIYVPAPEHAFWLDEARMQAMPEAARGGFQNAQRVFKTYPKKQLTLYTPGAAIAEGIESLAAFGHSPGHCAIVVKSGSERFTYLGDVVHYPPLFMKNPNWHVQFDMNPELASATRQALLARLAQDGSLVGGFHFPLPSMGRIRANGNGFDWVS